MDSFDGNPGARRVDLEWTPPAQNRGPTALLILGACDGDRVRYEDAAAIHRRLVERERPYEVHLSTGINRGLDRGYVNGGRPSRLPVCAWANVVMLDNNTAVRENPAVILLTEPKF